MKIGVDLDGVVFNSENYIASYIELNFMQEIDDKKLDFCSAPTQNRYALNASDFDAMMKVYEKSITKAPLMPYVKEALSYLKQNGHQLFAITGRGRCGEKHIKLTKKRLKKEKIFFDGYFFSQVDKTEACKNVDLMIDDSYSVLTKLVDAGVKCFQFVSDRTQKVKGAESVYNWGEICRKIEMLKSEFEV